jgi:hypothetical protein
MISKWLKRHTHRKRRETERERERERVKCGEKCETPKCSFFVIHACDMDKMFTNLKPTRTERKKDETLFKRETFPSTHTSLTESSTSRQKPTSKRNSNIIVFSVL